MSHKYPKALCSLHILSRNWQLNLLKHNSQATIWNVFKLLYCICGFSTPGNHFTWKKYRHIPSSRISMFPSNWSLQIFVCITESASIINIVFMTLGVLTLKRWVDSLDCGVVDSPRGHNIWPLSQVVVDAFFGFYLGR